MSDTNTQIIPYFEVMVRFDESFHPRGDFHTYVFAESMNVAEDYLKKAQGSGMYSDAQIFQCDMAYSNGLTQGLVGKKMVKKWKARKQEVRT